MTHSILQCLVCGTDFSHDYPARKYCSRACAGIGRRTRPQVKCQTCGNLFVAIAGKANKYCNQACYFAVRQSGGYKGKYPFKNPPKLCVHCGNQFRKANSKQRDGSSQENYYCSRACYLAVHSAKTFINCKGCGDAIDVFAGRQKAKPTYCSQECKIANNRPQPVHCLNCGVWFQGVSFRLNRQGQTKIVYKRRLTCSDACAFAWLSNNEERKRKIGIATTGERSPMWKGGATAINNRTGRCGTKEWRAIAAKARKRDGYKCQHCGITQKALGRLLDVHHIEPFHNFAMAKDANRLSNLISLCKTCHLVEEHKIKRRQMPLALWEHG